MRKVKQSRCVIGIKGQSPAPDYPVDIWFDSLKSVANVLSKENQQLLKVIAEQQPQSLTEIASISGRALSNVCRTLKTMEKHSIVEMIPNGSSVQVNVLADNWLVVLGKL
ncbi:helix-turn-helix domain-containing protein [Pseudoalteromonas sp. Z1A8]|uniref:HVO_A0114 family putative DNA-binding protein n=1 Tax=Pseudoalteromonas sp. Z1A8 TaxID=2686354 RepID=UPI00140D4119|nr:helix-turn-helix domain-containing protein [Pseudoalteromonas sp. Z1A8]